MYADVRISGDVARTPPPDMPSPVKIAKRWHRSNACSRSWRSWQLTSGCKQERELAKYIRAFTAATRLLRVREGKMVGALSLNRGPPEPHSGALPDCATPPTKPMLAFGSWPGKGKRVFGSGCFR